jgi:hypothetical protein
MREAGGALTIGWGDTTGREGSQHRQHVGDEEVPDDVAVAEPDRRDRQVMAFDRSISRRCRSLCGRTLRR